MREAASPHERERSRSTTQNSYGMEAYEPDHSLWPHSPVGRPHRDSGGTSRRLGAPSSHSTRSPSYSTTSECAALLVGMLVGAGLMFIFDPVAGRRRRALMRDKAVGLSSDVVDELQGKARHLRNRGYGMYAEARGAAGGARANADAAREEEARDL